MGSRVIQRIELALAGQGQTQVMDNFRPRAIEFCRQHAKSRGLYRGSVIGNAFSYCGTTRRHVPRQIGHVPFGRFAQALVDAAGEDEPGRVHMTSLGVQQHDEFSWPAKSGFFARWFRRSG